jgi:hypothetical protein
MSLIFAALLNTTAFEEEPEVNAPRAPAMRSAADSVDLMPIADTNRDGRVTEEEYRAFSEQGWGVVAQGRNEVKFADLDQASQMAFFAILPNAEGMITRQMYIDAIPARFKMFDQNGDRALSADELNGRAFQS